MTALDQRTGARARRRLKAERQLPGGYAVALCLWICVGLFLGAVVSVGLLAWMGKL